MKILKKTGSVLLCLLMALSFASCNDNDFLPDEAAQIWTAPSTLKVTREYRPENPEKSFYIELAKGETEAGQVIITANKDITYEISAGILKNGENTIPAENIRLYRQHYLKTMVSSNSAYKKGWYPDAIIPMEKAMEYNENTVAAGDNQGIWISVQVPDSAAAGIYTGEINLTINGEISVVPMSVKVFDFLLSAENHSKTAFAVWEDRGPRDMISAGYGEGCDRAAIVKNEYELLLDYRISPTDIPSSEYTEFNIDYADRFAKAAKKYALRKEIACFRIPAYCINRTLNTDKFIRYLKAIADECIDKENNKVGINIFKKACYLYIPEIDEPRPEAYEDVKAINDSVLSSLVIAANDVAANYAAVEGIDEIVNSILSIQHVVTIKITDGLLGGVQTWCPMVDAYDDTGYYAKSEQRKADYGEGTWWYTCMAPQNPYPTYHLDDTLVGARVMGWMQMDYGIQGNLYWATNIYKHYDGQKYVERDIWNDPLAFIGHVPINGDGYLTYPGAKYGMDAPIATIRLENIRDAQEDYEYLYLLQSLLNEANNFYATNVTLKEYIGSIYETLYSGTIAVDNPYLVLSARRQVAELIEALQKGKIMVTTGDISVSGENADITVRAESGSAVNVNGTAVTGEGSLYKVTVPLSNNAPTVAEVTVKKDNKTITVTRPVAGKFNVVDNFETVNWTSKDFITTQTALHKDGNGAVQFRLNRLTSQTNFYEATAKLDVKSQLNYNDFTSVKRITVYMYNNGQDIAEFDFGIYDINNYSVNTKRISLQQGIWNKIVLNVKDSELMNMKEIADIRITARNPKEGNYISIILDNMYLER